MDDYLDFRRWLQLYLSCKPKYSAWHHPYVSNSLENGRFTWRLLFWPGNPIQIEANSRVRTLIDIHEEKLAWALANATQAIYLDKSTNQMVVYVKINFSVHRQTVVCVVVSDTTLLTTQMYTSEYIVRLHQVQKKTLHIYFLSIFSTSLSVCGVPLKIQ